MYVATVCCSCLHAHTTSERGVLLLYISPNVNVMELTLVQINKNANVQIQHVMKAPIASCSL